MQRSTSTLHPHRGGAHLLEIFCMPLNRHLMTITKHFWLRLSKNGRNFPGVGGFEPPILLHQKSYIWTYIKNLELRENKKLSYCRQTLRHLRTSFAARSLNTTSVVQLYNRLAKVISTLSPYKPCDIRGRRSFQILYTGPILHRFWDTSTYWLKIAYFSYPSLIRHPRSLCSLWNFTLKLTTRKPESWGYPAVETW